ncbi:MAG: S1-like domain-containing RNA-binding protein [Sarcina sp.]
MIKIGEYNTLKVVRKADFGVYLGANTERTSDDILLPKNSMTRDDIELDDEIEVFIYRDSWDRLIATQKQPKATVNNLAVLEVKEIKENIGAFIDIGLERDVLVPYKEQEYTLKEGKSYLFYLYIDKTGRLAATTDVDKYLDYKEDAVLNEEATGIVYGYQTNGSLSIAVDNKYRGAVLTKEFFEELKPGDTVTNSL